MKRRWSGELNVKRFNINGHTAIIELSSTGIPLSGRWRMDEEELTDDELAYVAEVYADECQQWADDCRAEEEWERDREK